MKTYFTPTIVASSKNRKWFVSEVPTSNSLRYVHRKLGLDFKNFEEAEKAALKMVNEFNGSYLAELPKVGTVFGSKKKKRKT